jgi:3-oxoacyl-[acyl-carrier-protein] synthase II
MALNHAGFEKTTDTGVAADEGTDKTATSLDDIDRNRAGVAISSGIGSISDTVEQYDNMKTSYKKVSPYFVPKILVNMASGSVSIRHGLRGPCHAVATACAAGSHAIGDAYNFIRLGYADMMLTGGTEASVDALSITGFARMKALSNTNVAEEASRPFDRKRNGFVIGEGACVLVLEELEHVLKRGAEDKIVCEVVGYGLSGDAHHPTVPSGDGAQRSMLCALRDAGIHPSKVGYINAHATSTPLGDAAEVAAIERVFGCDATGSFGDSLHRSAAEDIPQSGLQRPDDGVEGIGPLFVSSTKGATGHLLGAAGAIESAFCCLALRDGLVPPTLNLSDPDPLPSVNEQTGKPIFFHVPNEVSSVQRQLRE